MRERLIIAVVAVFAVLSGCGSKQDNINLNQGMIYIEELNYQNALESFAIGREALEDEELLYRGEGIAYMGLSQYEEARDSFLCSIQKAASSVSSLEIDTNFYLAAAYYKLGDYTSASEIYSAILNFKKKDIDAYFLRGCCELKNNNLDLAMNDFNEAFKMNPNDMDLIIDAYEELVAAGFESEGLTLLQSKMDTNTTSLTESQKGTLYFYLGNYDEARIFLDQAVTHGDMDMSLLLGKTYEKLGDMNYACVVYQAYIDANNEDAQVYNNLGICLMSQGKTNEALESFEKGLSLGNSNVTQNLKFNKIVALEKLGDFSLAKNLMEEYLSFYPDDAKALREYEFLKTR